MFGYVLPVKKELRQQDFVLYRAFYCGICKSIGKNFGQLPRFTTTYDITFLSLIAHDVLNSEVSFKEEACVGNPFRKKVMVDGNALLNKLSAANIILTWYKLTDAKDDRQGGGIMRAVMKKPYLKAKKILPAADEIIKNRTLELKAMEEKNEGSIDRVSHSFASLLKDLASAVTGITDNEDFLRLCYNIGKFVFIADALDDIDEDFKKKNYNPFLIKFGGYKNRRQFIEDNKESLDFIFASTVNRSIESFNRMKFNQSYSLLKNIVHYGLREKVNELMLSDKKLPRPKM